MLKGCIKSFLLSADYSSGSKLLSNVKMKFEICVLTLVYLGYLNRKVNCSGQF